MEKTYAGYKQQSQDMTNWVNEMSTEQLSKIQHQLSDQSKNVPIFSAANVHKAVWPTTAHSEELIYKKRFTKCD